MPPTKVLPLWRELIKTMKKSSSAMRHVVAFFTAVLIICIFLQQVPVGHAEAPSWEKYQIWTEQYAVIRQRYQEIFLPSVKNKGWPLTYEVSANYRAYLSIPQWYEGLNTDLYLEDFLSIEVGKSTAEDLHLAVGAPHMHCGSGHVGSVYLTSDGYYIAYYFPPSHTPVPLDHAYICHVDWEASRDYEEFRQECLEQIAQQEKAQQLQTLLQWLIPCGAVLLCTALTVTVILIWRRKKRNDISV